ncbi:MAG: DUF885 domain-containing protein [Chloroflexota bacterium]
MTTTIAADLEELARAYWEGRVRDHPIEATAFGERRFDHLLDDLSPAARAATRARLERLESEVGAIDPAGLTEAARITHAALLAQLRSDLDLLDCELELWTVDPLEGVPVQLLNIEAYQPVTTPDEGQALLERWSAISGYVETHMVNLEAGLAAGLVAVRDPVERVIAELDDLADRPDQDWAFMHPLAAVRSSWPGAEAARFEDALREVVAGVIRPAFERYGRFLREVVLPRARPSEQPGLMHLPGGVEAYRRLVRVHTSLDLAPEELHRIGLREVERINAEMEALGRRALGTSTLAETLRRLRSDRSLYFSTRAEVSGTAAIALARAKAALPAWFGVLPRADCVVVAMGEHEEKHSTLAYYRQPAPDGSRPGQFFINTAEPWTRPRYEAEVLAYHESIPGHHLQIAIAQEVNGLPDFRRHLGVTAFWEGWGLYTERLADEMGLYSGDLDRIGMLSMDAWRACRLVVDTGMHALGWSRREAIEFMLAHSALAENNIVNEVDRYIVWPGQALAYKTGQLEFRRLRAEAEAALDGRFEIRAFHDAVLRHGAVPLPVLGEVVAGHVREASGH